MSQWLRGKRCEGCDEEECLRCSDMVLNGVRTCDAYEAELRRAFRRDGEDPMDLHGSRLVTTDQDGLVDADDVGGFTMITSNP